MIFIVLATLVQIYNKESFHFKNGRLTEILQSVRGHILIPYINLLNLFWIIKCLFVRNMEPLIESNVKGVHKAILLPRKKSPYCFADTLLIVS